MYSFIFRVCVGRNQATLGRGNNRVSSWLVEFTRFHNQLALYNSHRSKGNGIRKCKYKQSYLVTSLNKSKFNWQGTLTQSQTKFTLRNVIFYKWMIFYEWKWWKIYILKATLHETWRKNNWGDSFLKTCVLIMWLYFSQRDFFCKCSKVSFN